MDAKWAIVNPDETSDGDAVIDVVVVNVVNIVVVDVVDVVLSAEKVKLAIHQSQAKNLHSKKFFSTLLTNIFNSKKFLFFWVGAERDFLSCNCLSDFLWDPISCFEAKFQYDGQLIWLWTNQKYFRVIVHR